MIDISMEVELIELNYVNHIPHNSVTGNFISKSNANKYT